MDLTNFYYTKKLAKISQICQIVGKLLFIMSPIWVVRIVCIEA